MYNNSFVLWLFSIFPCIFQQFYYDVIFLIFILVSVRWNVWISKCMFVIKLEKNDPCHSYTLFCPNLSSFCDSNSSYIRLLLVIFLQSFFSIPWDRSIFTDRRSTWLIISSILPNPLLTTNGEFLILIIVLLPSKICVIFKSFSFPFIAIPNCLRSYSFNPS